jgi:hypothetical protein
MTRSMLAVALVLTSLAPAAASAQFFDSEPGYRRSPESSERGALELRIGPYVPDAGSRAQDFQSAFGTDDGLLLAFEYDVLAWRIPYVGLIGGAFGFGWAGYDGKGFAPDGSRTDETTRLDLFTLPILAVLRVDVLARELGIPFVFAGKLGVDFIPWSTSTGDRDDASGLGFGIHYAVQVALELDFLDRARARSLDEEWGINHVNIFFELYGSGASGALTGQDFEIGDPFTWCAGLTFLF